MSKTAKAKTRQPSIHSRAARRAASPSLNTDKSLKDISPPKRNPHAHIFSAQNGGIQKKKKAKQLTRGQLSRQRKGVQRADNVKEQFEIKVQKSVGKLKTIRERRKDWDVLNGEVVTGGGAGGAVKGSKFAALDDQVMDDEVGSEEGKGAEQAGTEEGMRVYLPVRSVQQHEPVPEEAGEDEIE